MFSILFSLQDICSRTDGCRPIPPAAELALEVLSYIGVVLSLVGIILTIITLLVFRYVTIAMISYYSPPPPFQCSVTQYTHKGKERGNVFAKCE